MTSASTRRLSVFTGAWLLANLAWDVSGLDLSMARLSGGASGFPLQEHWVLTTVLHDGIRWLAWSLALALCLGVWFPLGWLRRIPLGRRLQLAVTTLAAATVVYLAKLGSNTSCPWSLADFGSVAHLVSHWALFVHDGGSGGCFPAGHAAAGFAFAGGYFAFRHAQPVLARRWLGASLAAGLVVGVSQQLRGAHFMSHTLWTGWLCWCAAWLVDGLMGRLRLDEIASNLGELA